MNELLETLDDLAWHAKRGVRGLKTLSKTTDELEISTAGSVDDRLVGVAHHPPTEFSVYLLFWPDSKHVNQFPSPPIRVVEVNEEEPISDGHLRQMWDSYAYGSIMDEFEGRKGE